MGLLLALTEEPVSTRVWAQGAAGERAVAAWLDALAGEHVLALHDRRMRRPDGTLSKANIDHIAVTPSGVWVIDAKTDQGALEVRRSGGLFSPRTESLYINGRDRTSLVHGLTKQTGAVRQELKTVQAGVPVQGALCFVGTELPWFGSSSIVDVPLLGRRGLTKLLRTSGDLDAADRDALATFLHQRFPPAGRPSMRSAATAATAAFCSAENCASGSSRSAARAWSWHSRLSSSTTFGSHELGQSRLGERVILSVLGVRLEAARRLPGDVEVFRLVLAQVLRQRPHQAPPAVHVQPRSLRLHSLR